MRLRREMCPGESLPEPSSAIIVRTGERVALATYAHDCLESGDRLIVAFEDEGSSSPNGMDPRQILLGTITKFKQSHPSGTFEEFLQEMWPEDHRQYRRAKEGHGATKRSYSTWQHMFEAYEMEAQQMSSVEVANQLESSLQAQAAEYAAATKALQAAEAEEAQLSQGARPAAIPAGESEPEPEADSDTLLSQIHSLSAQISLLKVQIRKQTRHQEGERDGAAAGGGA